MKERVFIFLLMAAISAVNVSCDRKSDEAHVGKAIPQEVAEDFNIRYDSDIREIRSVSEDGSGNVYIEFTDMSDIGCKAIYQDADWRMTVAQYDSELFLSYIPRKIARTYISLGIEGEDYSDSNSYVIRVDRSGIATPQYEFCFSAPYFDGYEFYENLHFHIVISDDGRLLTLRHSTLNRSEWWHDIKSPLDGLESMYPSAEIKGCINDGGDMIFFVNDEGIIKEVTFRNISGWKWEETRFPCDMSEGLPESVSGKYEEYRKEHPEFIYDSLYMTENRQGHFFELQMNRGIRSTSIKIPVDGTCCVES